MSDPAIDPVLALATFLRADSDVAAMAGERVFSYELPPDHSTPAAPTVLLKPAGGGLIGQATQEYGDTRVDVDCYGRTPKESRQLDLAVYRALKHLARAVHDDVLLHWARSSSKGVPARDPETDVPVTVSSWQVLAAEIAVPTA